MTVDQGRHFSCIDGKLDPSPHDSELYRKRMAAFLQYGGTVSADFLSYYGDYSKIIDLAVPGSAGTPVL